MSLYPIRPHSHERRFRASLWGRRARGRPGALRCAAYDGVRRQRRSSIGPVVLLVILATWILLLWTGFLLLFSVDVQSVLNAKTDVPADFWERVYFTGFTISTLSVGDFVPSGAGWRVIAALASLNGLFLMTLAISYLIPVMSAVVGKRQLAANSRPGDDAAGDPARRLGWRQPQALAWFERRKDQSGTTLETTGEEKSASVAQHSGEGAGQRAFSMLWAAQAMDLWSTAGGYQPGGYQRFVSSGTPSASRRCSLAHCSGHDADGPVRMPRHVRRARPRTCGTAKPLSCFRGPFR